MRHRVFLCYALTLILPLNALAQPVQVTELAQEVESYIRDTLLSETNSHPEDIQVSVSNLDPRLMLNPCDQALQKRITSPRPYGRNLSVRVVCPSPKRWSIYVPAKIDQFGQVATLSHSLARGSIISSSDVIMARANLSQVGYGYLQDPARAIGMELKRPLQSGDTLRVSHLKKPKMVSKGDKVLLEAGNRSISVVTTGKALNAGKLGDQIQVRNTKSERVVDATVVAPGRVRVDL